MVLLVEMLSLQIFGQTPVIRIHPEGNVDVSPKLTVTMHLKTTNGSLAAALAKASQKTTGCAANCTRTNSIVRTEMVDQQRNRVTLPSSLQIEK